MSRVVPSQVVAFIDAFPALDGRREIDRAYLFGLADLLTEIPSQLLIMDPPTHASFICSRARVRETVSAWNAAASAGSNARGYISPATESAIQGIRAGLARCPDESPTRSEEHTSELQSRLHLVCRLLLEKKKNTRQDAYTYLHEH